MLPPPPPSSFLAPASPPLPSSFPYWRRPPLLPTLHGLAPPNAPVIGPTAPASPPLPLLLCHGDVACPCPQWCRPHAPETYRRCPLMRGEWPARWEPQEEGVMSIVAHFPSVRNQGLISIRRKADNDSWRWCLLVCDSSRQFIYGASSKLCLLTATWNLHTHNQVLCSQLAMRLSISPVCLKQRYERIEWKIVENASKVNSARK
jgi:hypothetical protein